MKVDHFPLLTAIARAKLGSLSASFLNVYGKRYLLMVFLNQQWYLQIKLLG